MTLYAKMRAVLRKYDDPMLEFEERERERDILALVLADPPNEAMVEKMDRAYHTATGGTADRIRAAWTAARKHLMEE